MADDQHRAVIVGDHFLQQVERLEVEVVGRLVEHQQVRLRARTRAPAAAATARRPTAMPIGASVSDGIEQEFLQIALDVLLVRRGRRSSRRPRRARRARACPASISLRCWSMTMPDQRLGQRRPCPRRAASSPVSSLSSVVLPAPLAPTRPIRSPRWMRSVKSLDDRALAEALRRHARRRSPSWSARRPWRAPSLAAPGRPEHRRALGAHLVELGQPALVAPAPRGHAALQPVQLELQLGVELLGRARFLGIDRLGPGLEAAEADLRAPQRRRGRATGSSWSAASRKVRSWLMTMNAPLKRLEPVLEPVDRGEVEMVGRLVEQQHVGLLRQRAGDRRPAPLAAAGGRDRPRQVDAELVGDRRRLMRCGRVGAVPAPSRSSVA